MKKKSDCALSKKEKAERDHGLWVSAKASRILADANFAALEQSYKQRMGRVATLSNNEAAIIAVFRNGPEVVGSKKDFIDWLNYPSRPLGGKTPLKLLLSNKARQVLNELGKIEYGVY